MANVSQTAQTQSLMTRTYKILKAAEFYKAWDSAKATMSAFGVNPARMALVKSTHAAYIAYLDENEELYDAQNSIEFAAKGL